MALEYHEKDIEDYIWNNSKILTKVIDIAPPRVPYSEKTNDKNRFMDDYRLYRQVGLRKWGRIDLLGVKRWIVKNNQKNEGNKTNLVQFYSLDIIELKVNKASYSELGQLMRYIKSIKWCDINSENDINYSVQKTVQDSTQNSEKNMGNYNSLLDNIKDRENFNVKILNKPTAIGGYLLAPNFDLSSDFIHNASFNNGLIYIDGNEISINIEFIKFGIDNFFFDNVFPVDYAPKKGIININHNKIL